MDEDTSGTARAAEDLFKRARQHLDRVERALDEAAKRLAEGHEERNVTSLIHSYHKALQTILDMEMELERRRKGAVGGAGQFTLDLAAARREIERRLARLRDCDGD